MVPRFRCWDKDSKVMRSWKGLILTKDDGDDFWLIGYKENACITSFDHEQILMQSTGLKDKNGVEIFEGDLVKVSVDNGFDYLFEELSIVKPSKFHSGLVCSLKSHEAEYRIIHAEILGYEYEVVGNIYENPELLEQANEN